MIDQRRFGDAAMWRARAALFAPATMPWAGWSRTTAASGRRKWPWTSVPPLVIFGFCTSAHHENSRRKRNRMRAGMVHITTYSHWPFCHVDMSFRVCTERFNPFRHRLRAALGALAMSDPSVTCDVHRGGRHVVSGVQAVKRDRTALP